MLNAHDLKTETFSNRDGWTAIRVTHVPSNITVERARTDGLRSAVQAQKQCVDELRGLVAVDELRAATDGSQTTPPAPPRRLDLEARIAELEQRVAALEHRRKK